MRKENFDILKAIIYLIIAFWLGATSFMQRIRCPRMTGTEIFLNIPNSFILDFKNC